jgi:hypothetical protein
MKSSHNLLHDWKAARLEKSYISQVEFLGSGIRTSFLRAWVVTAVKVLFIFTILNLNFDPVALVEENVSLLDQYVHNEYIVTTTTPMMHARRAMVPKIVIAANLEPRGPQSSEAIQTVAGDSTVVPSDISR